jgi:endonuclease/exonuclease/phosphatase family metal-dependent hydrolase
LFDADGGDPPVRGKCAELARTTVMFQLRFKVFTANVHKGFSALNRRFILNELREAVRKIAADVVFLQEVLGSHALHEKRVANWPTMSQYEFLADSIWPNVAYGRNAVYPEGDHGNALLSKFPIARFENHDFSYRGDETRGILHAVLTAPLAPDIHVFCVHFGLTEIQRAGQLALLCHLIGTAVPPLAPLIVAGDFNDWRLRIHALLANKVGLDEVFAHAHGTTARTFPAQFPLLRLDRIYVRHAHAHSPIALPRNPWAQLSDHKPLAAAIAL